MILTLARDRFGFFRGSFARVGETVFITTNSRRLTNVSHCRVSLSIRRELVKQELTLAYQEQNVCMRFRSQFVKKWFLHIFHSQACFKINICFWGPL